MRVEGKHEWVVNLSTALKKWLPEHGYEASTQLADDLGIHRKTWGHIIYEGTIVQTGNQGMLDGRLLYAGLHLWTGLPEADPRNIPDRLIPLPRGGFITKKRALSEEDYQKWLASTEAQTLLAKRNARFKREVIMEQMQPQEQRTAGSFLESLFDEVVNRVADQIGKSLSRRQSEAWDPQILALGHKIDDLAAAVTSTRAARVTTSDVGSLAAHLKDSLQRYTSGTSEERDSLMQKYGTELLALDIAVHTLTRRKEERESLIRLNQETKL